MSETESAEAFMTIQGHDVIWKFQVTPCLPMKDSVKCHFASKRVPKKRKTKTHTHKNKTIVNNPVLSKVGQVSMSR